MHPPENLSGRRFAVFGGEGRLAKAVTREFHSRGAQVECVEADAIKQTLEASRVDCFLAVGEEHEANLRAALIASETTQSPPVVIRAFDPDLADEIEGPKGRLHVRGAYSVAHLAAPDFVAAALLEEGEGNVVTLRLGDRYVNVCRIRARRPPRAWLPRSGRLAGRTPAEVFDEHGCQVLARDDSPLREGEEVLVGGRLHDVLGIARRQNLHRRPTVRRPAPVEPRRHPVTTAWWAVREGWAYLTTMSMRVLLGLLVLVSAAVMLAPAHGVADRFQLWVLTALGNPSPNTGSGDKLYAIASGVGLLAGGVALGLGISLMSAYFIDRRLDEAMRRRARRVRRHVVVVGLGDVGLRVAQLLDGLGVPCVVLDTASETESESRRRGRRLRAPVIPGELETGLRAAGVHRALSLIATSENNVLNVEACLRARRDGPKELTTVARLFDEANLERSHEAFGVQRSLAAVTIAAPAYVEAALRDECLRTFTCGERALAALRWPCGHPVGSRQMAGWHERGVRLLAVWREGEGVGPPASPTAGLAEDEAAILAGPEEAVRGVLDDLRRRRPAQEPPALRLAS